MDSDEPFIWSTVNRACTDLATGMRLAVEQRAQSVMILACSDNHYDSDELTPVLAQCPAIICGGLFPKIVVGDQVLDTGAIVIGLPFKVEVVNCRNLSAYQEVDSLWQEQSTSAITGHRHFVVFGDALCGNNEYFINSFYENLGSGITVIGGNAGFLDFIQRPCIFTNNGLIDDAMQVVALKGGLTRSTGHGWEVLDGPYLVTNANGHHLDTLNYEPAFHFYQETIRKFSGEIITADNFFDISKNFPLGIIDLNGDVLVRDPITTDLNALECVGNIPTNATVNLLKGDPKKLIDSSQQVADRLDTDQGQLLLLFNCISRILYLEEAFTEELHALQQANPKLPMIGALSLGEIANTECGAIHLLNKSTVIGALRSA